LEIPLISIDTLHALALGFTETKKDSFDLICPMIDARRMEVYASIFNNSLETVKPISADVIQSGSYSELIKDQSIVFIGDGAEKCKTLLMAEKRTFVTDFLPSAAYLGKEGFRKFKKTETENVAYFEPFYLKEFIALKGKKLV
jgi:tRNA threonylcarbamoyladenosine biosynthesis protein TsaB